MARPASRTVVEPALELDGVTKVFRTWDGKEFNAVDGVTLRVPRGQLFGFLGPNGAGKTTLLRLIHAFWPPTRGRLRVLGYDPATQGGELKARIGVAPQDNNLDPDFNVRRNLTTYARYFRLPRAEAARRADELLDFVGLKDKRREEIDTLSGGMKRRLVLARSLINEPDLILLDEPTTGLDPQARHLVWDKIRELRRRGTTILLTTHYMEEAELLCDDLVIMDGGKIHVQGRPADLIAKHVGRDVLELAFHPGSTPSVEDLRRLPGAADARIEIHADRAFVYHDDVESIAHQAKARFRLESSLVRRAGLEDVFLRLTGRQLRE
ncbi:MAG: ABC transporter ATP-binding protein [Euryarchaeota archaeon]|nr:ABC transporter ATP-binding protein [Euryarchaeota archaeon]